MLTATPELAAATPPSSARAPGSPAHDSVSLGSRALPRPAQLLPSQPPLLHAGSNELRRGGRTLTRGSATDDPLSVSTASPASGALLAPSSSPPSVSFLSSAAGSEPPSAGPVVGTPNVGSALGGPTSALARALSHDEFANPSRAAASNGSAAAAASAVGTAPTGTVAVAGGAAGASNGTVHDTAAAEDPDSPMTTLDGSGATGRVRSQTASLDYNDRRLS